MLRNLFRNLIQQRLSRRGANRSKKRRLESDLYDTGHEMSVNIFNQSTGPETRFRETELTTPSETTDSKTLFFHARALLSSDKKGEALYCYNLLELHHPYDPIVYLEQAATLRDLARYKEAFAVCDRAYSLGLDSAALRHIHGTALYRFGMLEQAGAKYLEALELAPNDPVILSDYGRVLCELGCLKEAEENLDRSLSLDPQNQITLLNLGLLYTNFQRYDKASFYYDRAIELNPLSRQALFCRSLYQLLNADFKNGWNGYSLRDHPQEFRRRPLAFPLWNGIESLDQTLLIHGEQGLGDEIMFASCIPDVLQQISNVVLECNAKLGSIFARSFPTIEVIPRTKLESDHWKNTAGRITKKIPIGDLPMFYRKSLEEFPNRRGYLLANESRVTYWRKEVNRLGHDGLRIGISWRGGTKATRRDARSTQLSEWLPILRTLNCTFVSLQYDSDESEVNEFAQTHGVALYGIAISPADYDETAAVVAGLDLIISVQTAVVHLAGALGKEAWVLLPPTPEWRYGLRNNTMHWYPSVQLLRADETGAWSSVINEAARRLASRSKGD